MEKIHQRKAEAYVREQCPELMELSFGCKAVWARPDSETRKGRVLNVTVVGNWGNGAVDILSDGINLTQRSYTVLEDDFKEIIGHPIQLQHWLRVLEGESFRTLTQREEPYQGKVVPDGELLVWHETGIQVHFNLTTGQPATEADYQAFNDIVGI